MSTTETSSKRKYTELLASNPKMSIGLVLLAIQLVEKDVQVVLGLPVIFVKVIGFPPHGKATRKDSI